MRFLTTWGAQGSLFGTTLGIGILIMVVWSLVWKGLALWRAARRDENAWFIALLIFNTLGILEIIYYFLITKTEKKETK